MRIGIVCPYSFDVPGGVQSHIIDLARALIHLGHEVSVLAPGEDEEHHTGHFPDFVVPAGRSVPVRYNGSVARLAFGPVSYARVRRWLRDGKFDVIHVHEPAAPSLSMLATMVSDRPIVATFHTANPRSRMLATFGSVLQPIMEKISGRIAVSELARRVQVDHMAGDAVIIPNGVDVGFFKTASPLPGYPRLGGTIGFVGRYGEQRKGMQVLLPAMRHVVQQHPDVQLLIMGDGNEKELWRRAGPELAPHIRLLGRLADEEKAQMLRSIDVYCAPNVRGESFGIILTEAMSAGAAIVASDLPAFRQVLADGHAGLLATVNDARHLADQLSNMLTQDNLRRECVERANEAVAAYDWSAVARQVVKVYDTVLAADWTSATQPPFNYPLVADTKMMRRDAAGRGR